MKTDKVQSPNFQAVIYKPNSKEYVKTFLTARDKEVFSAVTERFSKFKNWNLEITDKGMRVASKVNQDAFLTEEMYFFEPEKNKIMATATYDSKKSGLRPGNQCKFYMEYVTPKAAWEAYKEITTLPYAERTVALTDQLETQQRETNEEIKISRVGPVGKFVNFFFKK